MISQPPISPPSSGSPSCVHRSSTAYSESPHRTTRTAKPSTSAERPSASVTVAASPTSTHPADTRSLLEHSRLQPRGFRHHRLIPRRIEDELDPRLAHRRDSLHLVLHVLHQHFPHAAP